MPSLRQLGVDTYRVHVPWIKNARWRMQASGLDPAWLPLKLPMLSSSAMQAAIAEIAGACAACQESCHARAYQEGPIGGLPHVRLLGLKAKRPKGPPIRRRYPAALTARHQLEAVA